MGPTGQCRPPLPRINPPTQRASAPTAVTATARSSVPGAVGTVPPRTNRPTKVRNSPRRTVAPDESRGRRPGDGGAGAAGGGSTPPGGFLPRISSSLGPVTAAAGKARPGSGPAGDERLVPRPQGPVLRSRSVLVTMARTTARPSGSRRAPPDPEEVARRRQRAAEESLDVRLRSREPFTDLEVRNPVHRTAYRVLFPEYPQRDGALCTCTDFARRGLGTCKHVEAAWEWLSTASPGPAPTVPARDRTAAGELWGEIDRRLDPLTRADPSGIRDVEEAGSVLFEPTDLSVRGGGVVEKVGRPKPTGAGSRPTSRGRP